MGPTRSSSALKKKTRLEKFILGSVAQDIVINASCPVMIVSFGIDIFENSGMQAAGKPSHSLSAASLKDMHGNYE